MRISQKLVIGFIGIASLVAIIGAIAIKYNTNIVFDVDQILLGNSNEAKAATEITFHIQRIQANINRLLFGKIGENPEQKKYIKEIIGGSVSKLQQCTLLWEDAIKLKIELSGGNKEIEEESKTFKNLKTKIDGFIPLVKETVALQERRGFDAAKSFYESKVEALLLETQKTAEKLEKSTREKVTTDTEEIRKAVSNSTGIIIVSTVISLLAVIFVRNFIWWTISKPIIKLKDAADKIGRGELETEIQINSYDEIGALAQSFNDMACKLKEARAKLGERVKERTEELSDTNAQPQRDISRSTSVQKQLQQHIKQLSCFYGLSKLIEQPGISLEEIFQETVHLIRNAFQYPDSTCVRITFEGVNYKTDNFRKSELSQYAKLRIYGEEVGTVEVYYLGEKQEGGESPFLKEEHDLLGAIAEHLGRIAARRQTGEKLELLRHLIDRSNDCIFIMEPKWGRLLDTNDRACVSLGYTREELLKMAFKNIEQAIPDDSSWNEQMDKLKFKEDLVVEGQHRRKDGTTFFTETSLKLVSQKKEDFIIAIARNITERKQAEQRQAQLINELECTNQEVKNINQELKDFAYIVSHDLKAPLRGINTVVKWISSDYADKLDEKGRGQIDSLSKRVLQMHNLIDGILQYSRVGRIEEKKVIVNLNKLAGEAIDMVAPPENITITIENELPTIECEQTRIMQVFQNLLSNAVKYMDKPKGQIKIGCIEENGFWKFSVADNGPGIEEKDFERIFKIFQTVAPRDKFESTGIGLTVVKKIVELYKGKIWVESTVGEGATFFFTLPKQEIGAEKNEELQASVIS
jgi:PAS domain S-box-containing protein